MNKQPRRAPGRPRNVEGDRPITETILQAAITLFLSRGYEAVSMDDIAHQSGTTKASIYYYFPSKSELLTSSMIQVMNYVQQVTLSILNKSMPLREKLLEITFAHLQAIDFDLDSFMRKMEATLSAEQLLAMRQAEQKIFDALEAEFTRSSASGEIGPVNPLMAARAYTALLMMGHAKDTDGKSIFANKQEAAEQVINLLWNGLFPK